MSTKKPGLPNRDLLLAAANVLFKMAEEYRELSGGSGAAFRAIIEEERELSDGDTDARENALAKESGAARGDKERLLIGLRIPVSHAVRATNAALRDDRAEALKRVIDASYWHGCIVASASTVKHMTLQKKSAANKRHAEHYAIRDAVISYYEAHKDSFRSIEQAAQVIAKLEPVRHRTIRNWIAAHKKKKK